MARVRFDHITKRFGDVTAVDDVELDIADGEFVTFVGPSGCGKTTCLRMVAGLETVTEGSLYIGDRFANYIPAKDRGISMVFQSYALFPHMSVEANVAFGLKIKKIPKEDRQKKVEWALELLDMQGLGKRHPRELSGGQRQRVALGRALVLNPEVLLLDEPLSNLDAKLRVKMRTEIKRLHKTIEATIIYVTHDQIEAMTLSDRMAVMSDGKLMQIGHPLEVYAHPHNVFVAGFIGSPPINFFDSRLERRDGKLFVVTGDIALPLTDEQAAKVDGWGKGPEVVLGMRPQDIYEIAFAPEMPGSGNTFSGKVDVMEPLGDEVVATIISNGEEFMVTLPPETTARPDDPIDLVVDLRKLHLFDPDTDDAIC